jgi:hypothetical protein
VASELGSERVSNARERMSQCRAHCHPEVEGSRILQNSPRLSLHLS